MMKSLRFSKMLRNTWKFGSTMNLCGSLTPRRFLISWEMILACGKSYWMKSEKTEKPLITVKLRSILVQSSLITDLSWTESIPSMIPGTQKSLVTLDPNLETLSNHFMLIAKIPDPNLRRLISPTSLPISLIWSMNSKLSKGNTWSGQKKLKSLIALENFSKDKDTSTPQTGSKSIK